jgi:hypothetical protein
MRFDRATRTRLLADMELDVNPTDSTIELFVDGDWHPADWTGLPVQLGDKWAQTARSTGFFAGPDATGTGATVLTPGRHATKTRVTLATGDTLTADSTPIDVDGNTTTVTPPPPAPTPTPTGGVSIAIDTDGTPYIAGA